MAAHHTRWAGSFIGCRHHHASRMTAATHVIHLTITKRDNQREGCNRPQHRSVQITTTVRLGPDLPASSCVARKANSQLVKFPTAENPSKHCQFTAVSTQLPFNCGHPGF